MSEACPSMFVADCPARLAIEIIGDKWAVCVVWALSLAPRRHKDLVEAIGGISRKVLTQSLRRLQGYGLVERTANTSVVEYRLTGLGHTLVPPIEALTAWSQEHGAAITEIQEAR